LPRSISCRPGLIMFSFKVITLEEIPLFAGLTEAQIQWLRERMYPRTFRPGMLMVTADSPGEQVYFILKGSAKVYISQLDGSDVTVNIMGPGEPVGEISAVDSAVHSANVITLEETAVLWIYKDHFNEAIQTMPVFANNLLKVFSRRLRSTTDQIRTLASLDVIGRMAYRLLDFASRYGQEDAQGRILIPIRLTQNDVAELVGASRKRVNQATTMLKRQGCLKIDADYHITIQDRQALAQWCRKLT